jgi:hypothetical protein
MNNEQELWIFAFPTISRLGGHFAEDKVNPVHGGGQRQYARYLTLVMWPPRDLEGVDEMVQRGDGLCIVEEEEEEAKEESHASVGIDTQNKGFALGGRHLPQSLYSIPMIESWISRCSKLHPSTCKPIWKPELSQIYLLDVRSRRVIRHPGTACDYLALSYVWGLAPQSIHQFGTTLSSLPQTIEDAILVTLALGKNYLWVDSICIDQSSPGQKAEQISLMCDIYRGAYSTLVALSSTSATSGLPRVNPIIPTFAQLSCSLTSPGQDKEVKLVTTGLTLNQTIWVTKWGTRAWTFQEALLSPRNIYFSDHQVIFECNAMTCCESLNETRSHNHNLFWDDAFIANEKPEETYGLGVLRNPFVGESRRKERMKEWSNLLVLYMYRKMTDPNDSLNAFDGILKALQGELYPFGFHWGIPKAQFNIGLLWMGRVGMRRREGFPSWSWCGWEGPLWGPGSLGFVDGVGKENEDIQPRVKAVAVVGSELLTIFDNSASPRNQEEQCAEIDGLFSFASLGLNSEKDALELFKLPPKLHPGLLCITAPALKLRGTVSTSPPSSSESRWAHLKLGETTFHFVFSYCGEGFEEYFGKETVDWLVLAREDVGGELGEWYLLHLLGVMPEGQELGQGGRLPREREGNGEQLSNAIEQQVMTRIGSTRMWIRREDSKLLKDLGLGVRSILLA